MIIRSRPRVFVEVLPFKKGSIVEAAIMAGKEKEKQQKKKKNDQKAQCSYFFIAHTLVRPVDEASSRTKLQVVSRSWHHVAAREAKQYVRQSGSVSKSKSQGIIHQYLPPLSLTSIHNYYRVYCVSAHWFILISLQINPLPTTVYPLRVSPHLPALLTSASPSSVCRNGRSVD